MATGTTLATKIGRETKFDPFVANVRVTGVGYFKIHLFVMVYIANNPYKINSLHRRCARV